MNDIDYSAVDSAIEDYNSNFIDILTTAATSTYVLSSIFAYAKLLKKKVVPARVYDALPRKEIDALLKTQIPAFTKEHVLALKPFVEDDAPVQYVNKYKDELMKGGRTIAIGQWSEPDSQGVKTYLGYEKRWVPWLEQKTTAEKELIYATLTSGKDRVEIAKDLEVVFDQRQNYNNLVARTETLNNSRIITNGAWKREGIDKFLYVCSSQPGSPCIDLCSPFCGQIFSADNLPFDGELTHPNCRCSYSAIVSDIRPQEWENLPAAESSQFYKDIVGEDKIGNLIARYT
jgi:SPP1 gp7 family putative phage head morphogenesis protein